MNWLFISAIGLFAVCMFHGYRCGLVRMVLSVSAFLLAVVLVFFLAPAGVRLLQNNQKIYDAVKSPVTDALGEKMDETSTIEEVLRDYHMLQGISREIARAAEENGFAQEDIMNTTEKEIVADCITLKVIEIMVHVGLFLIIYIVLRVAGLILISVTKLPIVHGANQLAGCLLGMLEGITVIWLFFTVLTIFPAADWAAACFKMIEDSTILSILYEKNLFLVFI